MFRFDTKSTIKRKINTFDLIKINFHSAKGPVRKRKRSSYILGKKPFANHIPNKRLISGTRILKNSQNSTVITQTLQLENEQRQEQAFHQKGHTDGK